MAADEKKGKNSKALIVAYYYPPIESTGTIRTMKFVKYLPEFGWSPVVLTTKAGNHPGDPDNPELVEGVRIVRTKAFLPAESFRRMISRKNDSVKEDKEDTTENESKKSMPAKLLQTLKNFMSTYIFIPDEYIGWFPFAVVRGVRVVKKENISVIFATAPPNTDLLIGKWISYFTGKPLVSDFRDTWDIFEKTYNPSLMKWKQKLNRRMENKIIEKSREVITISDVMKLQIFEKFPESKDKIEVVENGFDPVDYSRLERKINEDEFIIIHLGNLTSWRSPLNLFEAIKIIEKKQPDLYRKIGLLFVGSVPDVYKKYVEDFKLSDKITFHERMPYLKCLEMISIAHCGLVLQGDLKNIEYMLTAKIYDYLGSRIPVFSISRQGQLKQFVEEMKIGINCDPDEPEDIAEKLIEMHGSYDEFLKKINTEDLKPFTRKYLTSKLVKIFDKYVVSN
ncbi:MAG: glycosyltransferase family 4 protein [bacterium]|nr:glycosyltransferase family 4 protein [bacterium]